MASAERVAEKYKKTKQLRIFTKLFKALTEEEVEQLKKLTRDPSEGSMRSDLSYGRKPTTGLRFTAVLAKEGDQIVGWWSFHGPSQKKVAYVNAFVSPKYRGKGIGKSLGKEVIRHATNLGAQLLVAVPQDSAGKGLYLSLGFEKSKKDPSTLELPLPGASTG